MTRHLFGGHFRQASKLASTLIHDINPWLPHRARFRWSYVATHATLWLDMRDQFAEEHHMEWEAQKSLMRSLNNLECDTKVIYQARLIKRQDDKEAADSKEAAAKQLPPERQVACTERQARAMPMNLDAAPARSQATLHPNWVHAPVTKPQSSDPPRPYRTPRQDTDRDLFFRGGVGHQLCVQPSGTWISIKPTIGIPAQFITGHYDRCCRTQDTATLLRGVSHDSTL